MVPGGEDRRGSFRRAVASTAAKIGRPANASNVRVTKAEVDDGWRAAIPSDMAERVKALEREERELRQADEILPKASARLVTAEFPARRARWWISPGRIVVSTGSEPVCAAPAGP